MTISALLKQRADFLNVLDLEVLLAYALGETREYLLANPGEELAEDFFELFMHYVERVRSGEPVAYITGEKEFFGLNFFVDRRVLIPRPETELLVERVLEYMRAYGSRRADNGRRFRIVDVGTGSGNIAVAIAKNSDPDVIEKIFAIDVDSDAVEVARLNAEQHSVDHLIDIFQSDLLENVDSGENLDIIVANLPYIGEKEYRFISESAERYEPHTALFGGWNGLALYERLFSQLLGRKFDFLIGEFGFAQADAMQSLLNKYFDQKWRIEPDLSGIDRIFTVEND